MPSVVSGTLAQAGSEGDGLDVRLQEIAGNLSRLGNADPLSKITGAHVGIRQEKRTNLDFGTGLYQALQHFFRRFVRWLERRGFTSFQRQLSGVATQKNANGRFLCQGWMRVLRCMVLLIVRPSVRRLRLDRFRDLRNQQLA